MSRGGSGAPITSVSHGTMPKSDEWVKLTIEKKNKEKKRKLTSSSIGLLENRLVLVKLSNSMMVSANIRGKGFKPTST